jgi:uncharacterized protein involved in exopolysaccharide biosynthesis
MAEPDVNLSQQRDEKPADQSGLSHPGQPPRAPASPEPAGAMELATAEMQRLPLPDDVVDWMGFIRRQWLLMAAVWLLVMVCVSVALYYWPRQYTSGAKFLVKNARQEMVIGATDGAQAVQRDFVSEETLNTELELLRSWDILTKVVRDLNLDRGLIEQGKPPEIATELATRGLFGALQASAIRKTNVVQVSYTSPDPVLAQKIVQHVADTYLAAHLAMHSTPGTYELFKAQADAARTELRDAEQQLAALARSSNLIILDTQKQEALKAVQELEAQLNTLNAEMHEQETRAKIAELHMSRTPQRVPTVRRNVPAQSSVEHLHTMIVELNNKKTQALTRYQPTDRLVVELDKQIADTTKALERAKTMDASEESTDINPSWQSLDGERTKARLAYAGLQSKAVQVKEELELQRARTLQITEAGPQYEELTRRVAESKSRYELYSRKEEEARITEVLDRQRISNVVLAQAPVVSHVPSKPNVRLGVVAGGVFAGVIAVGIAFLRELFGVEFSRRRKKVPTDVTVLGISSATPQLR